MLRSLITAITSPNSTDPHILQIQFRWIVVALGCTTFGFCISGAHPTRLLSLLGTGLSAAAVFLALAWSPGGRPWWERPGD